MNAGVLAGAAPPRRDPDARRLGGRRLPSRSTGNAAPANNSTMDFDAFFALHERRGVVAVAQVPHGGDAVDGQHQAGREIEAGTSLHVLPHLRPPACSARAASARPRPARGCPPRVPRTAPRPRSGAWTAPSPGPTARTYLTVTKLHRWMLGRPGVAVRTRSRLGPRRRAPRRAHPQYRRPGQRAPGCRWRCRSAPCWTDPAGRSPCT